MPVVQSPAARTEPGESQLESSDDEAEPRYAVSGLGMALVAVGAVGLAISVFLPYVESTGLFSSVKENSLIQQNGWYFLLIALAAVGTAYRNYSAGRRGWAPIVWGLIALGYAIKYGADKSARTLYSIGTNGEANTSEGGKVGGVGIGVYVAGAAGVVTAWGGWLMRKAEVVEEAPSEQTKRCPDCAETILAEARVCKHSGYRFT
jgi:hypothetical protein